ncbi:MAG: DUF6580 family putative transport protein [Sphingomicrobium sp.]
MTVNRSRLVALLLAILAAALLRLVPHPPNFTPIGAMALFSGAYLGRRWLAFAAPLAALLLSDLILGFYEGMLFQYAATLLAVGIGWAVLSRRRSTVRVGGAALGSAILFFLVSNFGVWLSSGMYPRDLGGLGACYVAAIPFFQNSLAGDLIFSALLFGGWALAERTVPSLREARPAFA